MPVPSAGKMRSASCEFRPRPLPPLSTHSHAQIIAEPHALLAATSIARGTEFVSVVWQPGKACLRRSTRRDACWIAPIPAPMTAIAPQGEGKRSASARRRTPAPFASSATHVHGRVEFALPAAGLPRGTRRHSHMRIRERAKNFSVPVNQASIAGIRLVPRLLPKGGR